MTYLRKRPRQERARATFEAIVESAARILGEHGERALTTNRIAERAGVSVGSLYQYFPDRRAIVRALLERELAQIEALRPATIDDPTRSPEERVRAVVDWTFDVHGTNPALAAALARLAARVLPVDELRALATLRRERTSRTVASLAAPGVDVEAAAFLVETCLDAVCHRALRQRPDWLLGPRLRAETTAMIVRWLRRSPT